MLTLAPETEALIQAAVALTGKDPDQVLRDALIPGKTLPTRNPLFSPVASLTQEELVAQMEAIAVRSAARPTPDPRSVDEIMGYDDYGLPR